MRERDGTSCMIWLVLIIGGIVWALLWGSVLKLLGLNPNVSSRDFLFVYVIVPGLLAFLIYTLCRWAWRLVRRTTPR